MNGTVRRRAAYLVVAVEEPEGRPVALAGFARPFRLERSCQPDDCTAKLGTAAHGAGHEVTLSTVENYRLHAMRASCRCKGSQPRNRAGPATVGRATVLQLLHYSRYSPSPH